MKTLPRVALPTRAPCECEGAIVSACTSCNKNVAEENHERQCTHPADDAPDLCTRNNAKSKLPRCSECKYYVRAAQLLGKEPPRTTKIEVPSPGGMLDVYGSDKNRTHKYGPVYDEIFARGVRSVLEVGVLRGESLRAWQQIMGRRGHVHAIDIDPACEVAAKSAGATFTRLDAGNAGALRAFAAEHTARFDLIVDDASHEPLHQINTLNCLYRALKPGGTLVIEDIYSDAVEYHCAKRGARIVDNREASGHPFSRLAVFRKGIRPRVLFVSQCLDRNGAPIILRNLIPMLRGFDVELFSFVDGPLRQDLEARGVKVIIGALDVAGFDLVVANTVVSAPAVEAAYRAGIPCVWMIHESDTHLCGNFAEVRRALPMATRVVFPCTATADVWKAFRPHGVDIVPSIIPPVSVVASNPPRKGFVIYTLGTDEPRKGQSDIRTAIAGMPETWLVAQHGQAHPWSTGAHADLYVCSSRIEAYPLALQEAKAYGLPVITTDVFGCKEIIRDGIDGSHYQPGDVARLRKLIEMYKANRSLHRGPLTHLPTFDESVAMYERSFRAALGAATPVAQSINVVYHVAGLGNYWKGIVTEQLGQLRAAGLLRVYCTHVGVGLDWLLNEARRHGIELIVAEHLDDVRHFETPAIHFMERLARTSDAPILYLHGKGVTHDPDDANGRIYHEWRRLMMRELVDKWHVHARDLIRHDAVGVNWWTADGKNHFSGNFWLASAAWIRKLRSFAGYFADRYSCETWIGSQHGCRAKSLLCHDKAFWAEDAEYMLQLAGAKQ